MVAFLKILSAAEFAPPSCEDNGVVPGVDAPRCDVLPIKRNAAPLSIAPRLAEALDTSRCLPLFGPIEDDPEWEDDDAEDDDDEDDEDDDFFPDDEDDDFDDDEEDDGFDEFEDEDDDF